MPKIILEREKCIGCGSCESLCPKYWKLADDGKINFLGPKEEIEEIGCSQEAADACPAQCIIVQK